MGKHRRNAIIVWAGIALFLVAFAYCIPKTSDDWYCYLREPVEDLLGYGIARANASWTQRDGRWLGNVINSITTNDRAVRIVFWTAVMGGLLFAVDRLTRDRRCMQPWWALTGLMLLFASPAAWFSGNIAWMQAFGIYMTPIMLTLLYLLMLRGLFSGGAVRETAPGAIACLALGFVGQMFNEVITVYRVLLAIGVAAWYWMRFRRPSWLTLLFLLGAAAGARLMFSAPSYAIIANASEGETYQRMATSIPAMLSMAVRNYPYVSAFAIGANTVPVCCVSLLGIAIVGRGNAGKPRPWGLSAALIAILAAAPVYFYFTTRDMGTLLPLATLLNSRMLALLLDAAVYAAYVLSIFAVLLAYTDDAYVKGFGCLCLLSVLGCAAPLFCAAPLAHRIFAGGYVFFCLLALVMLRYALSLYPQAGRTASVAGISAAVATCLLYLCMFGLNPKVEREKMAFIEWRMTYGETTIWTPDFPYGRRLWYPESELWACYYYEEKGDIAFEHIPYDMWRETYFDPSILSDAD